MSLKPQNADQRSPSPNRAHNPTEARCKSPGTSPSLPFPGNNPKETERKPHVDETLKTSFRRISELSDCSGSSNNAGGPSFRFSWDDVCLYLYGRLTKEPVILRHDRGDRKPNGKRSGDEEEGSMEKLGMCTCMTAFASCQCRGVIVRLRAVPIFVLSSSSRGKTSRKPAHGNLGMFPRAGFRDVFPRLDELKRKNRDCSQSKSLSINILEQSQW